MNDIRKIESYRGTAPLMLIIIISISSLLSCKTKQQILANDSALDVLEKLTNDPLFKKKKQLSEEEFKFWYHMDYQKDTVPGISLSKLYDSGLLDNPKSKVVVAVLDTKLDIHHEDLQQQIWINDDEIPDNDKDDDENGYVDDINGWDFLSNSNGEYVKYQSTEALRIIKKYREKYEDIDTSAIDSYNKDEYELYQRAIQNYNESVSMYSGAVSFMDNLMTRYEQADQIFDKLLPSESYSISAIDSVLLLNSDSTTMSHGEFLKYTIQEDLGIDNLETYKELYSGILNNSLNIDNEYRTMLCDDLRNIKDAYYGGNIVYGDVPFQHSIAVTGVIGANRANNIGIKGFSDNIEIMPIVMVASGDEEDKDIAVAIRYAVDNGAKIINMSWGKEFSLNEKWVGKAIKYAADHNVLIVHGSGNESSNNDNKTFYPNDNMAGVSSVDNFIEVGASTYTIDSTLIAHFSNYGQEAVDVFAPGVKIYTTEINDNYGFSEGTSLAAPLVSGLAALLWTHFPNLTALQIKEIILKSGNSYDVPVVIIDSNGEKKTVPFNSLSKTGKVINAFNAFTLAKEKYSIAKR